MKKEFLIIVFIFLILSLGIHYEEFFSYPVLHIKNLQNAGVYGLGSLHPLIFTLLVYVIFFIPRLIIGILKKTISKPNI